MQFWPFTAGGAASQRDRGVGLAKDFVFLHRKFRSANVEPEPQISMKFRRALADMIQAALMLKYNKRKVG